MGSHTRTSKHKTVFDDAAETAFFAEHGYTRAPVLVQWMATLRCPLSCEHCLAVSRDGGFEDMALETALRLVDEVAEMPAEEFLVTGGEPLVRPDLPAVIERLGRRGVGWSLNTSCFPPKEARRMLQKHPPQFVAVSLDGPEDVHDAFRGKAGAFEECLESVRFFKSLPGCRVAAGTTVTTRNFPFLKQTFQIAAECGADSWGIHLLVPEGRARRRTDLFLSRRQLGKLLRYVARVRNYFPVNMADEFGYCGHWEPMVRDVPFRCGAGTAQCVVLPDGSVVPCTTLDRAAAAGNINDTSLAEIWENGFARLRKWRPEGKCSSCKYAPACGGGCWLQRRRGTQCYRDVWEIPGALKTAAGVAVCLGVLSAPEVMQAGPPPMAGRTEPASIKLRSTWGATPENVVAGGIEQAILKWYCHDLPRFARSGGSKMAANVLPQDLRLDRELAEDPAGIFLILFRNNLLPKDITRFSAHVRSALRTKQRSLAFSAMLWRAAAELCMDGKDPAERSPAERKVLRDMLAAMEQATGKWRKEIFDKKLDPYLARGRIHIRYRFEMSKISMPPPTWLTIARKTAEQRWGTRAGKQAAEALEDYLKKHPYAEAMRLSLETDSPGGLVRLSAAGDKKLQKKDHMGIYDVLRTGRGANGAKLKVGSRAGALELSVSLPADAELTYADLLKLAYKQNAAELDSATGNAPEQAIRMIRGPYPNPLLLPAMRKRQAPAKGEEKGKPTQTDHAVKLWLADFWMF